MRNHKTFSPLSRFVKAVKICGIRVAIIKAVMALLGLKGMKITGSNDNLEPDINTAPKVTVKTPNKNEAVNNDYIKEIDTHKKNTANEVKQEVKPINYIRSANTPTVSVIIPFNNAGEFIIDSVESVIAQSYKLSDMLIYLIDDGSTDCSSEIAKNYANIHKNVKYFRQENKGVLSARNRGIEFSLQDSCDFTFFLDADNKYERNHIEKCIKLFDKYPESVFVAGMIKYFGTEKGLDVRFNLGRYAKTREIDVFSFNPDDPDPARDALYIGHVGQGGWRTAVLEECRFNETPAYSDDIGFIARILSDKKFVFSRDISYLYRKRSSNDSTANMNSPVLKYYSRVLNVFAPLYTDMLERYGNVPMFIQQVAIDEMLMLFADTQNVEQATPFDYEKLDKSIRLIIRNTNDTLINHKMVEHWYRMFFYTMKYGTSTITRWAPLPTFIMNETGASDDGYRLGHLGTDPLVIHIINEKLGILIIRASMRCLTYEHFALDVQADFQLTIREVPTPFERDKVYFCEKEIFPRKYYEIEINLNKPIKPSDRKDKGFIRFLLTTDYGVSVSVPYDALPHSGLGFNVPFTLGDRYIIKRTKQSNILKVSPFNEYELLEFCPDVKPYSGLGQPHPNSVKKFEALKNSILNNFRAFSNCRIWLFIDRGYDVGNNAEALFRYCATKDDGIQKYYIIPDESFAERFAGLPYILLGSLEYKLLCCFAEKFISPYLYGGGLTYHNGVNKTQKELWEDVCNFKKLARAFFRGDIIHVQHGVIMQDISYYMTKFDENIKILLSVSQKEYDYVKNDLKHALDDDILRLTGLPRNDYLEYVKNNPNSQKIVLFAPSWDMKFDQEGIYAPEYKYSKHFEYLDSVLSSQELLGMLEDNGYTLYFKPHLRIIPQLRDFNIDPKVVVITDEIDRYELYTMTDIMISDYSGIAFDFAYLKKPVIYAHFTDKPKFDKTYFSYELDGFGDICTNIETLVEAVKGYINNGCEMSGHYQNRVDAFFSIQDNHNCERIYQELLKLPDTRKNIYE